MKSISTIIFLLVCFFGYNQTIPYAIKKSNIQEEILLRTIEFDSLILVDKASFWSEDFEIKGIGFIDYKFYRLRIDFERDDSLSYTVHIDRFRKKRIRSKKKIELVREIDLRYLSKLHDDSLNLKTRGNIYMEISDASFWTMLIVDEKILLKQSYAPYIYQEIVPTQERAYFMESINKLEEVIK